MQRIFLILVTLFVATSCSKKTKETIGIVSAGPNEYRVLRGKFLEVPPHYELSSSYQTQNYPEVKSGIPANLNEGEKELIKEIEGK